MTNSGKRDYRKVTETIARQELLNSDHGFKEEDLRGKSRKELIAILKNTKLEDEMLDSVDLDSVDVDVDVDVDIDVDVDEPNYDDGCIDSDEDHCDEDNCEENKCDGNIIPTDPRWHDYVMGKFVEDELKQGNPTTDGLRRVAELLIDKIASIGSHVYQSPDKDNMGRATVKVNILFDNGLRYDGCADVFPGNTNEPYGLFPVATAETRAEGRALKRALRLRKVVAAEEMADNVTYKSVWNPMDAIPDDNPGMITDVQINFLELMCGPTKLDINVEKFVTTEHPKCLNIKTVKHEQSLELQDKLAEHQRNIEDIPKEIKGYDSNWRSTFC